jgi:hypothetical protein
MYGRLKPLFREIKNITGYPEWRNAGRSCPEAENNDWRFFQKSTADLLPFIYRLQGALVRLSLQKQSALQIVSRTNETQILQTQCSNICKLNYPAVGGGYQRYPWYPCSADYRGWSLLPQIPNGENSIILILWCIYSFHFFIKWIRITPFKA